MSLNIGGGNITPNPQLTMYDLTVSTQDEVAKKGGAAGIGNRVVLMQNTLEVMLTDMGRDPKYKYTVSPERPLIPPPGSFRASGTGSKESDEAATNLFDQLFSALPEEMQKTIREARDQDALVLKDVLKDAAKALELQQRAIDKAGTLDATERAERNSTFPNVLFRNAARVGKECLESARDTLETITANDPAYLHSKEMIDGLEELLVKAKLPEDKA